MSTYLRYLQNCSFVRSILITYGTMTFTNWLGIFVSILVILVVWYKRALTYWERKGLYGPPPSFPLGNAKDVISRKKCLGEFFRDIYFHLKSKGLRHGGIYIFAKPMYVVADLELVKRVLQTDFANFNSHGMYTNKRDPVSCHIFNLEKSEWRNMRLKMTPTFTSAKMKMMFQTLVECTIPLEKQLEKCVKANHVDLYDIIVRFTTDIIGSCAFGLEINSLTNENSEFRKYGKMIFEKSILAHFKGLTTAFIIPHWICRAFNVQLTKRSIADFFQSTVMDTIKYREENNIKRNDFMHLMIQQKEKVEAGIEPVTDAEIVAQCYLFFIGGFETSSKTLSFLSYELAKNMNIQERTRKEIVEVLAKHDNKITYEGVMEMNYLESVICETLRKYPPLPFLFRQCTKDYKVPDSDLVIEEGTTVQIPIFGIHYDPEIYPDPEKFDPDRFSVENKKYRSNFSWLPFGDGPRICLGQRFGMMQVKMGLITLLRNYKLLVNKKMAEHPILSKEHVLLHKATQLRKPVEDTDTQSTQTEYRNGENVLAVGHGEGNVLLRMVKVKLYGNNTVLETVALCDEASSVTLADKSIANRLGLDGTPQPLCIQWTNNSSSGHEDSSCLKFKISGVISGAKFLA
ncbi:hypothetical protein JTB14_034374 [Gonioctena quinquepunctata]|nr:hypothetical protein JTB14_034374 [Gonioctena quinquepunctata]